MKRYTKSDIIVSAICLGFVIALAAILCVLRVNKVMPTNKNPYSMLFADLVLGIGLYVTAFAVEKKYGIEYAVGAILIAVAATLFAIRYNLHIALVILLPVIILAIAFVGFVAYKYNWLKSKKTEKKGE